MEKVKRILCIGDSRPDVVIPYDEMKQNSFSGGVCTAEVMIKPGGTVSNCASMLGKLGADVSFMGVFGDGEKGQFLIDDLVTSGVSCEHCIRRLDGLFPVIVAVAADGSQVSDALFLPGYRYTELCEADFDESLIDKFDIIHISGANITGLNETSTGTVKFIEKCAEHDDVIVSMDLNLRIKSTGPDDPKLALLKRAVAAADIIFGSGAPEFEEVTGLPDLRDSAVQLSRTGKVVIARDGAEPVILALGDTVEEYPVSPVVPINTIGAGDSFDAGFLRLYSEGYSIRDCVKAGNICAGYTISHSEFRAVPEYEKLTEAIR